MRNRLEENLTEKELIAVNRYKRGEKPSTSLFIDEETITYGYGVLDSLGEFEYPLPVEFIDEKEGV